MLKTPARRYQAFVPVNLPDRTWPNQVITQPPLWLSTDLRDGNQALAEPMDRDRKLRFFQCLTQIGFKQIEVGFPAASQTEFDFVRHLIDQALIPEDVTIQVLTQSREPLIRRTFEALRGVKRAIVHVYNATAPNFRRIVFNADQAQTIALATQAAQWMRALAAACPETDWTFQYSPETFTATELDFAKEICDAVLDIWQPTPAQKAIINLPASVEVSTPNVFADQVEWMHRHLTRRDSVVLSVHNHHDRGTSVAAAELAQMAGAERVEGCLFGNGERTGNVDLVTLAMNLYTQGIYPGLDFSQIDAIAALVQDCTQLPIHPRHPYVGELVYTAFSGSHQDAIKKGLAVQAPDAPWEVPYLPLDPADVGRTYESVVRVNSQSGKGGIAFLLERDYGLVMPRPLQVEFGQVVQQVLDGSGPQRGEMTAATLWQLFEQTYLQTTTPLQYLQHRLLFCGLQETTVDLLVNQMPMTCTHLGNGGPIEAFVTALNEQLVYLGGSLESLGQIQVKSFEERSLTSGSEAQAVAFIELRGDRHPGPSSPSVYGVGIHSSIVTASLLAVISGVNRLCQAVLKNPVPAQATAELTRSH